MSRCVLRAFVLLSLLPILGVTAQAATHQKKHPEKKYHAEHKARGYRHHKRTPAQQHLRNLKYAKEHQARQHRHRAHMKAKHH